jgi:4'-phosphopantetheinyl transferase
MQINHNELHLWEISSLLHESKFTQFLTPEELTHAHKFLQEKDKNRYIVARASLKKILSLYLKIPTNEIEFEYNEYGKPALLQELNSFSIQFNISHSHELILLAFTLHHKIGVDIEYKKQLADLDSIAKTVFSHTEYSYWQKVAVENKLNLFYQLWTYKEALIKALSFGFSYDTKNFTVTENNQQPKIIFHDKGNFEIEDSWTVEKILLENNDYCAAYATPQIISKICWFDFNEISL